MRYPGSKSRFAKLIAAAIRHNGVRDALFVEPFCGGASVSVALLEAGVVERIALNDADPDIASFWEVVFDPDAARWLAEQVASVPLTLAEWDRQKALAPSGTREAALRCLYLNRTSFNGIIHWRAGPIGGRAQAKRTLDVRFNRERLASRILELSRLSDRVAAVDGVHWKSFVDRLRDEPNAFFYLDPPFYHKAETLYQHCFSDAEHRALRNYLRKLRARWILSYDDAPEVRALYQGLDFRARVIDSVYSAHPVGGQSFIGRELLYTNLPGFVSADGPDYDTDGMSILDIDHGIPSDGPVRRPYSASALTACAD